MISTLQSPLTFSCGATLKNRFMLAPLTNSQSNEDGTLSQDELHWLTMRAKGGFGLVMTCASHVQAIGKGFPGQLGIFSEIHISGHEQLTESIKDYRSLAVIQLHHAGMRSPKELIGQQPVCPSENKEFDARALSLEEVKQLRDDFIAAAVRSKTCGYDGVEIHGAHGYIIAQFLSAEINKRTDQYGGSLENRARILFEIIDGIRLQCGSDFLLGVRLSPERFGVNLMEIRQVCEQLISDGKIDFLDISVWDYKKMPEDEEYNSKSLLSYFTSLDTSKVKLTVAGKIRNGEDVVNVMNANVDFVTIGRSAILHHNFPELVMANPDFMSVRNPVSSDYLKAEGLGEKFINYLSKWPNFVTPE
jgi:2,4-dienoyl-CoA reductase-like NADH-dependent reductase (Old Yellow Enzyme family)